MAGHLLHLLDRKQSSGISFFWIKGAKHVIELMASRWNKVVSQSIWTTASGTKAPLSMVKIDEGIRVSFKLVCMRSRVKDLVRIMTD